MRQIFTLSTIGFLLLVPTQFLIASATYTIAPLVIDIDAEARDILMKQITIVNTGDQPLTLYPSVNNISLDEGGTIQEFLPPVMSDRSTSLAAWIEIKRSGIIIPVGESRTVDMTLRVNPSPKPGEYHAFIGFGNGRNQDIAYKQVESGSAPGIIVTVNIKDDKVEFLKLSRFLIDRFVTSNENESAKYVISNPGDEPLIPQGEIIIYNTTGGEVASIKVNEEGASIPPGEEKEFAIPVPSNGLFGKYKAFLSIEYGNTQRASLQDTAFFYVFPLKIILSALGSLLFIVIITAWYVHRRYLDETVYDDSESIHLEVRETRSDPMHHDIDLTKT